MLFQALWAVNDDDLPIAHASRLARGRAAAQASRPRWSRASCARWSAPRPSISASTGATSISWCRSARPRARAACCSASAAPTTGSTSRRKALFVPSNRFEVLECEAALEAVEQGAQDSEDPVSGGLDVLAQHVLGMACAAPFDPVALYDEVRTRLALSRARMGAVRARRRFRRDRRLRAARLRALRQAQEDARGQVPHRQSR